METWRSSGDRGEIEAADDHGRPWKVSKQAAPREPMGGRRRASKDGRSHLDVEADDEVEDRKVAKPKDVQPRADDGEVDAEDDKR